MCFQKFQVSKISKICRLFPTCMFIRYPRVHQNLSQNSAKNLSLATQKKQVSVNTSTKVSSALEILIGKVQDSCHIFSSNCLFQIEISRNPHETKSFAEVYCTLSGAQEGLKYWQGKLSARSWNIGRAERGLYYCISEILVGQLPLCPPCSYAPDKYISALLFAILYS